MARKKSFGGPMKKAIILILLSLIHSGTWADSAGRDYPRGGTPIISSSADLKIISELITVKNEKVEAEYLISNNTSTDISTEIIFPFYYYELQGYNDPDTFIYIMELAGEVFKGMQFFVSDFRIEPKVEINAQKKWFEVSRKVQFKKGAQTKVKISYRLKHGWRGSADEDFYTDEKSFWFMCETAKFLKYPIDTFSLKFCGEEVNTFQEYSEDMNGEIPAKALEAFPKGYSINKKDSCIEWKQNQWQPKDDSKDIRLYFTKYNVNK